MRLNRSFAVPGDDSTVRSRLTDFLQRCGYERVYDKSALEFHRGLKRLPWYDFNPANFHCRVKATIVSNNGTSEVDVTLDIDTTGHLIGKQERVLWNRELDNLESAVKGKEVLFEDPVHWGNKVASSTKIGLLEVFVAIVPWVILSTVMVLWLPSWLKPIALLIYLLLYPVALLVTHAASSWLRRRKKTP